jgi:L-alanine-DL-glutamate epimerase-like enolase superfamily enzyme
MRGAHLDGQSLIQFLKPVVLGQDPLERERLSQAMWQKNRQTTYRAIGAMDVALWDIAGKAAGLPIHRLLGSYRASVPAYASSSVLPSKKAYAEEAAHFKAEGWTAYKIHPPTDPDVDIEVCRAVRKAVATNSGMRRLSWISQEPLVMGAAMAVWSISWKVAMPFSGSLA